MRTSIKGILVAAVATTILGGCKPYEPLTLQIAHVNDTHAHFDEAAVKLTLPDANQQSVPTYAYVGGYPRLATKVKQLRESAELNDENFLLLHAGDAFSGTLFFTLYKGQLNADFMNQMEFDAMTLGNHEFDLGNQQLAAFADAINFPLLSANIKTKGNDPLHGRYLPFTIKMVDEQPVAIVGLTTAYTEIISSPSDDTTFDDTIETAEATVSKLRKAGINKIVLLTHLGLDEDKALAGAVSGIDVIIGGHSHDMPGDHSNIGLGNQGPSPVMINGPDGEPVCIMHSGEYAMAVGVTDVSFTAEGLVDDCQGQNIVMTGDFFVQGNPPRPVDSTTKDVIVDFIAQAPNIEIVSKDLDAQAALELAKTEVAQFASTVVGTAAQPLYHVRLPGDAHPEQGAIEGGSMVALHVARSMASKLEKVSAKPYIAIMNAGGVRADLEGSITVGDAYTVLPFSSTLVSMSVSGESFAQTLQTNISNAYAISGVAFPYTANVSYTLDLADPAAPMVRDISIKDANGIYQPIDLASRYNLVTTSYLAGGGDLYAFPGATDVTDTGHIDAEALVQYIETQPGGVLDRLESGISIIK